ncbi:MAG: PHP domain-containing protein [Gammaproteobacteria bacterium]|nr:PHP domain-containing protein [Gammaproteobacteria bacterium]
MEKGADLHTHTTASDGSETPASVVAMAAKADLEAVAITDHDTMDGIPEGVAAASELGITLVPGVELSTEFVGPVGKRQEVHVLGYFPDPSSKKLADHLLDSKDDRERRAGQMVEKLNELGVRIAWGRVLEIAGDARIGRPHIARAIMEAGYAKSWDEVFAKWIGNDAPGYVGRSKLGPADAVEMLRGADAVTSLAHPMYDFHGGVLDLDALLPGMLEVGLQGLEVYCSNQSARVTDGYRGVARKHGLLATGGSDFHGDEVSAGVKVGAALASHEVLVAVCELGQSIASSNR